MNSISFKSIVILIIFLINSGCIHSQNNQKLTNKNQPKVDIKVNKKYDDKGNVIGYDSTYSYSYSDTANSPLNDSIFNRFHNLNNFSFHSFNGFPNNLDSLFGGNLNNFDKLFKDPFFNNNFDFYNDPLPDLQKMLKNLDSLRNRPLIPAPNEPNQKPKQKRSKPLKPNPDLRDSTNTRIKVI